MGFSDRGNVAGIGFGLFGVLGMSNLGFRGIDLSKMPVTRSECANAIGFLTRSLIGINEQIAQLNDDKNKGLAVDSRKLSSLYLASESAKKTKILIESRISVINEEIKMDNLEKSDIGNRALIKAMRELITEDQFLDACARARGEG